MFKKNFMSVSVLLLMFILMLINCSEDSNPVSSDGDDDDKEWSTVFSAVFTGADGTLVGSWTEAGNTLASNFNNKARGQGGDGGWQAIAIKDISEYDVIRVTAKISNCFNGNTNAAYLIGRAASGKGYFAGVGEGNISIYTMSTIGPPGEIPGSNKALGVLDNTKWYILEFTLKKSGDPNLIGILKQANGTQIIKTTASHTSYDEGYTGFGLQAGLSDFSYLDNFKVEKYE